jgi:ubiquinol-cytochrome c reductase cytochrome b subunit
MGLGLTGYLLPWDQKGYWATNVATNLATLVPFVGKDLQQLAVGGNEYGHHTLTRFFAMHTGVLPALLIIFLVAHIMVFRRHGITAKITPGRADEHFWPKQVLFDAIGCAVLLGIVLLCVVQFDLGAVTGGSRPLTSLGAELGAPADPAEAYSAARPEWYYLFLFQLLKYFPGNSEFIGAIVIPGVVMTLLALLPFVGRWNWGHQLSRAFIVVLLLGAGVLTALAFSEDYFAPLAERLAWTPIEQDGKVVERHPKWLFVKTRKNEKGEDEQVDTFSLAMSNSHDFMQARRDAEHDAHRTLELINRRETLEDGTVSDVRLIPKQGAVSLLRNDPASRGPRLFKQHCASCHDYVDAEGKRLAGMTAPMQSPETTPEGKVKVSSEGVVSYSDATSGAPNLYGFASRSWIKGLLNADEIAKLNYGPAQRSTDPKIAADKDHPENYRRPIDAPYFGNTNHRAGRMAAWVKQHAEMLKGADGEAIAVALSAQAQLRSQAKIDGEVTPEIQKGITLIQQHCTSCHRFGKHGQLGLAPDLTGYGSYEWMMALVSDPTHERFYRHENDRMPSFAKDLAHPEKNNVSVRELSLIVDWLRGQYYLPEDEQPVLPHSPEAANEIVQLARTVSEPRAAIVGASAVQPLSPTKRAERLFADNCAACHSHADASGRGIVAKTASAPNLLGFGSRAWAAGILDAGKVAGPDFFGNTRHKKGQMAQEFVQAELAEPDDAAKAKVALIALALSAEAALPAQAEADKQAEADGALAKGRAAMSEAFESFSCTDCHKFQDTGDLGSAPDLTGWGSKEWLTRFISDPGHEGFYRDDNDRMPAFGKAGPGPKQALLSGADIELLARWIRGEKLE